MSGPNSSNRLVDLAWSYLDDLEDHTNRARFVMALSRDPAIEAGDVVDRAIAAVASDDEVDHKRLVAYAARRITKHPSAIGALESLQGLADSDPSHIQRVAGLLEEPLSLRALSDHVFADHDIERLITALRTRWLEAAAANVDHELPSHDVLAAVALQMHTTEWVYDETESEATEVDVLAERIKTSISGDAPSPSVLVYAMYRPLASLGVDHTLMATSDRYSDRGAALIRRHLVDPIEASTLATRLPRLTDVVDPVSVAVRSQYEERPYPRWHTAPARKARPFGEVVAKALGNPDLAAALQVDEPEILVAGCGTGRHAVGAARRYEGARVLAVDLSTSALAYGALRAQRQGISNIEFAHADILGLGQLDRRFDVIECVGVLHHMAEPEAGWAALRRLLKPGGLMKVGLYSHQGRQFIDPISHVIDERGLEPTVEGIRAVRHLVADLPVGNPARMLSAAPDFYSRSGCRDLFFHEHEDRFDLPRIRRALDTLDLEFLGFELPTARIRGLYLRQFPDEPTGRDLSKWELLERSHPGMFSAMYRFWTRAID